MFTLSSKVYEFKESDLEDLGQIGHGEFGSVHKVLHKPSNTHMALKRIGPTVGNQGERKKVLKELDFVLECHEYEYVVRFYGVKFNNEPVSVSRPSSPFWRQNSKLFIFTLGRLSDLHGAHGHVAGKVLQVRLREKE